MKFHLIRLPLYIGIVQNLGLLAQPGAVLFSSLCSMNLPPCCQRIIFQTQATMKISAAFAALAATIAVAPTATAFAPASVSTGARTAALFSTVDDKTEVREYFNNEGFNRWNKIYSDSDEVNSVQLDIRNGHDQTIQKILNWIADDGDIAGKTVCDCGCGVGSLAIPLAQMGEFIPLCATRSAAECQVVVHCMTSICANLFATQHLPLSQMKAPRSLPVTSPMPWLLRPLRVPSRWVLRTRNSTPRTLSL